MSAQEKKPIVQKIDLDPTQATENVRVPVEDIHGYPFPTVRINNLVFEPGKTYKVTPEIAFEVNRIVTRRQEEHDKRLMNPRAHAKTVQQYAVGSQNSPQSGAIFDARSGKVFEQ